MKPTFAILPWEHPGAAFDPTPHARASLEIAGAKREFLLKMRDGLLYFKEPARVALFAIPHHFDADLRGDALIGAWQAEVARGNFGRCHSRSVDFFHTPGSTVVAAIIRPDFSGWVTDAFHPHWREIPAHRDGRLLNFWKESANHATWRAVLRVRDSLCDRPMPHSERQPLSPRWARGDEASLRRIFALIIQLYTRRTGTNSSRTWKYYATNMACMGGFDGGFSPLYNGDLRISPLLSSLLRLLHQHFVWVAMDWQRRDTTHYPASQWPANEWRGSYKVVTPCLQLDAPLVAVLSNHERLEFSLELRDWLEGKVSPRQSANWLAQTLD